MTVLRNAVLPPGLLQHPHSSANRRQYGKRAKYHHLAIFFLLLSSFLHIFTSNEIGGFPGKCMISREYWIIYRGPDFLATQQLGSSPTSFPLYLPSASCLSLSVFLCVAGRAKGMKGEGEPNHTTARKPEPVFLNVYGAQESIPRNEFHQPM